MASIRLELVSKAYAAGAALQDLSLEAADGELLVLLGPSGAGKTTTLRLIAGLEAPDRGRIRIGGADVTDWPPHQRDLAMVFQEHTLYPHLTVRDNLGFGLKMRRAAPALIAERVRHSAAWLRLEGLLDRLPSQLSGGERQRVALGRALARQPRALLLDEPFAHLDPLLRAQLRGELHRLQRQFALTVIHVTHDHDEARQLADRVALLEQGQLRQIGPAGAVLPENASISTDRRSPPR